MPEEITALIVDDHASSARASGLLSRAPHIRVVGEAADGADAVDLALRRKPDIVTARLEDLDYGYIDGIIGATRQYPLEGMKKDEIDTALGYFENNAPRMRYHWYRQCGLFTGSGVIEASCKTIVGQRLKQSGMHWTVNGADAIIALRCRQASSTWEAICNTPHTQTRTA